MMRQGIAFLLLLSSAVQAEVIGQTYPVVESDMLNDDIMAAVESTDWKEVMNKEQDEWGAFNGIPLPDSVKHNVRKFIPWYTNEIEVRHPKTGVLYPKGFTFNPLEYITMPFRVLVVSPEHDDWLIANIQPTDNIIYTTGNTLKKTVDLNLHQHQVGVLNAPIVERFKLRAVPSIVTQQEKTQVVEEISIEEWRKEQEKMQ